MSKWLIIGSTAAYHWFGDKLRKPKDIDLLTPVSVKTADANICFIDTQWHDVADRIIEKNSNPVFADADILYTLKVSHAEWDIHWDKTMYDIHMLKELGAKLDEEIYDLLIPVWKQIHKKKNVNLNKPVKEFFTDHVKREYDHEYLHELVSFYDRPLHERIRKDLNSVSVSKELFYQLDEHDQYLVALEELMVTAIERGNLNYKSSKLDIVRAVNVAYKQLVTSMTTGWFAEFLIINHYHLIGSMKKLWMQKLMNSCGTLR